MEAAGSFEMLVTAYKAVRCNTGDYNLKSHRPEILKPYTEYALLMNSDNGGGGDLERFCAPMIFSVPTPPICMCKQTPHPQMFTPSGRVLCPRGRMAVQRKKGLSLEQIII